MPQTAAESHEDTGGVEVSDKLLASSGFADLRSGTYRRRLVVMKTLRVIAQVTSQRLERWGLTRLESSLKFRGRREGGGDQGDRMNGIFAPTCDETHVGTYV